MEMQTSEFTFMGQEGIEEEGDTTLGLSSSSNHVHGTPSDHGQLSTELLEEEEEEDSLMQEEQAVLILKKKKMQEEQALNDLIPSQQLLKLEEEEDWTIEIYSKLTQKAEDVQTLKKLGFSASEDQVVHKNMKGQVKRFEHWHGKSRTQLTDANLIMDKICIIMLAHIIFVQFLPSWLKAMIHGSTKNKVLIIVELIILSVINIILLYNSYKQNVYLFKLRAKAKKLIMKVKNQRSNLVYVARSHPNADDNADSKIDYACIQVAMSSEFLNSNFSVVVFLLCSLTALSFVGFVQLWYAWHELTVQW